jgi:DNA topoisomerase-3
LTAALSLDGGRKLYGKWLPNDDYLDSLNDDKKITDNKTAFDIAQKLDGAAGSIVSAEKHTRRTPPPLPYSLSKLQMAASRKYDITDTLEHVQKLYESGYVTYPRTNCEHIPEGHHAEAPKVIDAIRAACPSLSDMLGGVDLTRKDAAWDTSKISEHHAIIPTAKIPATMADKERKIYELVCIRKHNFDTLQAGLSGEEEKAGRIHPAGQAAHRASRRRESVCPRPSRHDRPVGGAPG